MRKLVKIGVASLMVCGILATTNALAVWVEGGQWNYGVGWTGTFGYSDYLHSTRYHTATVRHGVEPLRIMQNLRHGLELPSPRFRQQEWNISMDLSKFFPLLFGEGKL